MSASGIRMYKLWSVYIYVHSLGKWCDDIYIVIFTFKTMVDFSLHILILYTETPLNTPPQVENVTVTRGVSDGSPSLTVSWSAVPGSGITYTVWYSTQNCTIKKPSSGATNKKGITSTSITLSGLTQGTKYYIWVTAVSSDAQGCYSTRESNTTFKGI